jgi:hypothetical protein
MMNIKSIKSSVYRHLINIPGWRTNRKIVVIESDDWGAIRMPSKDVYEAFLKKGFEVEKSLYNRFDALESNDDLTALYDVLMSFQDWHGNHPVFTANCVVANPDFQRIKESGNRQYFYEHVSKTLSSYPQHDQVIALWHAGIQSKVFYPQSHGREHLNIKRWMNALQNATPELIFAFDYNTTYSGCGDYSFMGAFDYDQYEDVYDHINIVSDGLELFRSTFGYSSKTFISPCYVWDQKIEIIMKQNGVEYIQGGVAQYIPTAKSKKYKKKYHFTGEKNYLGQRYLVRNCLFEPTSHNSIDTVSETLKQITIAFNCQKPAIISSHRVNYIGYLDENNRANSLVLLRDLLSKILRLWPDVEFISSDSLGDIISNN